MTADLDGKVVVVTGAARGIGAAYATAAAALGARVIVNDLYEAAATVAAIQAEGGEARSFIADISDWESAQRLIDFSVEAFGRIDGLVNNAGIFAMDKIQDLEPTSFNQMLRVNVLGTVACTHHAVRHMNEQGRGSIVNVTSGTMIGMPNRSAYAASKAAVASLTYVWALELAGSGIRVNAVSPIGMTQMADSVADFYGYPDSKVFDLPDPQSNAGAVCFLLSDESARVSGQVVRIDGSKLSLIAPPTVADPVLECDAWDFAAVANAFTSCLAERLMPVGLQNVEASRVLAAPATI